MEKRLIDANGFDERVRAAGGMVEEELTEDFKDGVLTVLDMLKTHQTVLTIPENPTNGDMIMALFPGGKVKHEPSITHDKMVFSFPDGTYFGAECRFNISWWHAPYKNTKEK